MGKVKRRRRLKYLWKTVTAWQISIILQYLLKSSAWVYNWDTWMRKKTNTSIATRRDSSSLCSSGITCVRIFKPGIIDHSLSIDAGKGSFWMNSKSLRSNYAVKPFRLSKTSSLKTRFTYWRCGSYISNQSCPNKENAPWAQTSKHQ